MKLSLLAGVLLLAGLAPAGARGAPVRVAVVVSDGFNVIDFAGAWEVFPDATLPATGAAGSRHLFELYTVATQARAVTSAGGAAPLMSACTGARKRALAGLLDGRPATTHQEFLTAFGARFPRVRGQAGRRWVRAGERLDTAGALTSGIDVALQLVAAHYGRTVAQATADYMEYPGDGGRGAP